MTIRLTYFAQRIGLRIATAALAGLGTLGAFAAEPPMKLEFKKPIVVGAIKPLEAKPAEVKPLDLAKINPKLVLPGKKVAPVAPKQGIPKDLLPKDLVQKLQPKKPGFPKDLVPKDKVIGLNPPAKFPGPKDLGAKPNPKFPGPGDDKPGDLAPNDEQGGGGGGGGGGNGGNGGNNNDPDWLEWLAWLAWINAGQHHNHDHFGDLQPPVIIVPEAPPVVIPQPQQPQAQRFEVPIGADLPLGGANFGPLEGYAILQIGDLSVSLETPAWQVGAIVVRLPKLSLLSAANADLHLYDADGQYLTTVLLRLTPAQ